VKVLFLDDMPARHRVASQWFPAGTDIVRAHDAYECIGLYLFGQSSKAPFDVVSLDRDLGERRTGEDVVDQILRLHAALPELARPRFAVHSWNLPAAERMFNRLQWAGFEVTREPFSPPAYMRERP
jgi:hypothetical protein